jgi:4-hydroxy-tetrahydrodipicolinate reductase
MIKVILSGSGGKMGQTVARLIANNPAFEVAAGLDQVQGGASFPTFARASDCTVKGDVVIDFSHPAVFSSVLRFCVDNKIPFVSGTTGLTKEQTDELQNAAKSIPVFYGTNMSMGVFILNKLVKQATEYLYPDYDIEIIEAHHNLKVDAPSGTAKTLLNNVQSVVNELQPVYNRQDKSAKRAGTEVGMHSIRGGTIVGTHEVIFAGFNEMITVSHEAQSKDIFANGALKAAAFVVNQKPAYYTMEELVAHHD